MSRALARLALKDQPIPEKLRIIRRMVEGARDHPRLAKMSAHSEQLETLLAETDAAVTDVDLTRLSLREKVTRRNASVKRLCKVAASFKAGVQCYSGNDPATLLSAGVELMADIKPIGLMPAPESLTAMSGSHSGTVLLRWKRVKRRYPSYLVQIATQPDGDWKQFGHLITRTKQLIDGLEPGVAYWFRVATFGTAGQGSWSPVACARAA